MLVEGIEVALDDVTEKMSHGARGYLATMGRRSAWQRPT
jgi:hypothetical protein